MTAQGPRKNVAMALAVGTAAVVGGLWLLLNAQGVAIPQFKDLWPILLVLAGVAFVVDWLAFSRAPRSAGWAVVWVGLGILAFALTLDYTSWKKILDWLPSFPTILGLAFLTTWLAGKKESGNLAFAGAVLVGLGLMGYAARFDFLKRILPSAQVFWAILLLAGGGLLVWRAVSRSRG